ncbi:hypothetical protein SISNIDRAFT_202705 [Sistotremastrum niveocremeum HHB9708]|uniref:Uncharacterized protein n=1 Tax=Sistotremastrum niveocremeum HHB9708 TaxID=1314777 RepID=A0A164ZRI5_9AGAM|nr:hypothetical protein SISNIDRAFT_202705 [Sistotremastrum niveocremeum HHB9708]
MYQQRDYRPPRGVTVVEAPEEYDSNDGSAGYSPRSESESSQSTASRPSRERALIDALEDPRGEVDEHAEPERSMSPSTVDDAASPVVEEPQEPTPMPMPAPMPLYTPVPGPLPMPMPQADPVVLQRAMSPTSVTSSSRSRGTSYRRERSVDARRARVETDNESEDSYEHELERETESRRGYHSRRYEPPVESRSHDRTYSDRSYSRSERRDHDRSTSHSHSRSRHDEDRRHYPEAPRSRSGSSHTSSHRSRSKPQEVILMVDSDVSLEIGNQRDGFKSYKSHVEDKRAMPYTHSKGSRGEDVYVIPGGTNVIIQDQYGREVHRYATGDAEGGS